MRFAVDCELAPFRLERLMRLPHGERTLVLEESVRNTSGEPAHFVWGHHCVLGPPLVWVWGRGIVELWRRPEWRPVRFLVPAFVVVVLLTFVSGSQPNQCILKTPADGAFSSGDSRHGRDRLTHLRAEGGQQFGLQRVELIVAVYNQQIDRLDDRRIPLQEIERHIPPFKTTISNSVTAIKLRWRSQVTGPGTVP